MTIDDWIWLDTLAAKTLNIARNIPSEKDGEINKRSLMFIKDSTTRGSIITRVDDELCQKLICRCRQARKSGAAAASPLLLPSLPAPPTPLRISTS